MAPGGLDDADRRLVRLLQTDAGMTREALGRALGLSAPAVHQRVRKLEAGGVIAGYHARVNAARVGRPVLAFLRVEPGPATDVARLLDGWRAAPEILECHRLGRTGGYLLKLRLVAPTGLAAHLDAARRAGCCTEADFALESVFERWIVPDPH